MGAADDGQIVLNDSAPVIAAARITGAKPPAGANASTLVCCSAERERGKSSLVDVLETDFSGPAFVDVYALIQISKPVVAERKMIEHARANGPILGQARQPARGVLQLIDVGGQPGWLIPTAARRIVPLPEV